MTNLSSYVTQLHSWVETHFPTHFPTVQLYGQPADGMTLPGCVLTIDSLTPASPDGGTGQVPVQALFSCYLAYDAASATVEADLRDKIADFALKLYQHRPSSSNLPAGVVEFVSAEPYAADDVPAGQKVWRLQWRQRLDLGADIWAEAAANAPKISSVNISRAPEIGLAHEANYTEIYKASEA